MKKVFLIGLIGYVLTGCAPIINRNHGSLGELTYTEYMNKYEFLNTYTINGSINKSIKDVNVCVLQNIRDKDVVLSDNANSFVGSTGRYYNLTSSTNSYGNSQKYINDDVIIINGFTQYQNQQSLIPVTNYVRYTLSVKKDKTNIQYIFNNITQAQSTTGSVPNNGFNPIGNWDGANPSVILKTLNDEIKKIEVCLGG